METKKAAGKKEETVILLLGDKFLKDMSSELINFYRQKLNLSNELNENEKTSSISKSFSKSIFSAEKMDSPFFTTFLMKDEKEKVTEKLLKELTGVHNKQLDITIEKNMEIGSGFNNQFIKVIKTNEKLLYLDKVA